MAKQILGPNTRVTVNGTDLSDHCTSLSLEDVAEEVDVTGFNQDYREYEVGLRDASITATFLQDYAGSSVDAVIGGLYYANTAGTLKVTPDTNGTVVYTLVSKPYGWSPVSGDVGAANTVEVTFRHNGTAGLTRGTA